MHLHRDLWLSLAPFHQFSRLRDDAIRLMSKLIEVARCRVTEWAMHLSIVVTVEGRILLIHRLHDLPEHGHIRREDR